MPKVVQKNTIRYSEKRRGIRLNSRVPISIEWENSTGVRRCERAHTRVVGPYGCLVVLPDELALLQEVQLTNLVSDRSNRAIVVWCGPKRAEGWELGIALVQPEPDFWGLEL